MCVISVFAVYDKPFEDWEKINNFNNTSINTKYDELNSLEKNSREIIKSIKRRKRRKIKTLKSNLNKEYNIKVKINKLSSDIELLEKKRNTQPVNNPLTPFGVVMQGIVNNPLTTLLTSYFRGKSIKLPSPVPMILEKVKLYSQENKLEKIYVNPQMSMIQNLKIAGFEITYEEGKKYYCGGLEAKDELSWPSSTNNLYVVNTDSMIVGDNFINKKQK